MKNTDLHVHTFYSDGLYSPKKVINLAKEKKLKAISITDHDSIDGLDKSKKYCLKNNIELIDGVEIQGNTTEILGYFINKKDNSLLSMLDKHKLAKKEHTIKTLEKLQEKNIDIEIEEVLANCKNIVMKSEIAKIMCKKGYANNIQDVYKKYFKNIKVKTKYGLTPTKKVIKTIIDSGGVACLPHPWFLKDNLYNNLENFLEKLESWGLAGVETTGYCPDYKKQKYIKNIVKKNNLLETGGSDFHGLKYFPYNILGKYNINYSIINKLKKKIK
jgi:hypothetical protein